MNFRIVAISVFIVLLFAELGHAFDGNRKGFVLGFGTGVGTVGVTQKAEFGGGSSSASEQHTSLVTNFKIGGAPTDQIMIYWSGKVSWFGIENAMDEKVTISAGTGTVAVSYFWKPSSPCWFASGGLGYSSWDTPFEDSGKAWTGFGLFLSGGYEFAKYWSVEFGFNFGNPSTKENGIEFTSNHSTIFATINVLGY